MTDRQMTVVCVDDEEDHAELLRLALEAVPDIEVQFLTASSLDRAVETLRRQPVDMVFLDYRLGSANGADVLRTLRAAHFSKPVVMLTAHGNEYVAASAIRAGADEYLSKADIAPGALAMVLERAQIHADQRIEGERALERADKLEEMSRTLADAALFWSERARRDSLTGILSRTAWEEAAGAEIDRAMRFGHPIALCLVDIDGFKAVNDIAGHLAGDACLQEVARAIVGSCRTVDSVGRFGGDEFVMLLPETTLEGGLALAERARVSVLERDIRPPSVRDSLPRITISAGVASGLPARWQDLAAEADRALYEAKRLGRNRVEGREAHPQSATDPVPS
jgi:diguanylate cyclase (GGDEF)-like protein